MNKLHFTVLEGSFTLHRLKPDDQIQNDILGSSFYSITRTDEELSIICSEDVTIENTKKEENWACIKILGPLPFEMTGVLAKVSACLAESEISIFAISSYDTDYIFIKNENLEKAVNSLSSCGLNYKAT